MTFMKSLEELLAIKEKAQAQLAARDADGNDGIRVVVGMATCGIAAGARPVLKALVDEVAKRNVQHVSVTQTGCIGMCQYEPIVEIFEPGKEKVTYVQMTAEKAQKVVAEHLVNGKPVVEYTVGAVTK
jgi:NADP-reducing hydrogenase subunit HndB